MSTPLFHYLLIHWLIAFIPLGLGIFVVSRNSRNPLYWAFLRYNFVISWWGAFNLFMEYSPNEAVALFWDRISLVGIVFIPAAFIHFTWMYSGRSRWYSFVIKCCYGLSTVFLLLVFTPYMARSATPKYIIPYFTDPGAAYHFFVVYFSFVMGLGNLLVLNAWRKCRSNKKKTGIFLFFLATSIATIGGGGNFMVPYQIYTPFLFPYGGYAFIFYGMLISYVILKHSFFDMEVIVKKTLVFAGLFGVIMAAISIVTVVTQGYLGQVLGIGAMTRQILSVLIAMALFDPTRKYLVYLTDAHLFQRKEDFKVILNRLAKNIVTILNLHAVGETVLETLQESLRLETGAVLIRNEKSDQYSVLNSFNLNEPQQEFSSASECIRYFSDPGKIVNLENLEERKNCPDAVRTAMEALKAVIAVPLFVQSGLTGLLLMGKKKSDQEFTQEEIDYLPTVASQTAIALRNAQLVDDVIHEREEKIIAQNKAEQVNYASSLSHETGNALVGITSTSQNISEGLVQDLRKLVKYCENKLDATLRRRYEEIADKIYRFSKIIEQNSEKVRVIIKTASGGLKDNRSEKEEISFRFVWNHAKKEANINDVRYDGQMPDPFIVFGNTSLLTRVLVNLFINSRDAMIHIAGERCIHLEASYRAFEGRQVAWIEYWDDGPGIPEELFAKVFEQGFSTKPKPKGPMGLDSGYGQGLYYCRKFIEEFHKGRIWLEKKDAGGSKFVFWIPADKEGNGEDK